MDIRPLTREEQLEWYTSFLKEQIEIYMAELVKAEEELATLLNQDNKVLTLEKKDTGSF